MMREKGGRNFAKQISIMTTYVNEIQKQVIVTFHLSTLTLISPRPMPPQIPSDKEFVFEVAPKFTIFIFLSLSHSISALTFYIFTTQKKLKVFFTLCKFSFSLTPNLRRRMMKRKRERKK
jgi:hypothetical protein